MKTIGIILFLITIGYAQSKCSKSIAILDFETKNLTSGTQGITDLFRSLMFSTENNYCLIERNQINKITNEQAFQQAGYVNDSSAVSIGKLVGATHIILGSIDFVTSTYLLSVRLVDVTTGSVVATASTTAEDELSLAEPAAKILKESMGGKISKFSAPHKKNHVGGAIVGWSIGVLVAAAIVVPAVYLNLPKETKTEVVFQ